jgi:glycosyltransferase involved in cell wall biosynthesis
MRTNDGKDQCERLNLTVFFSYGISLKHWVESGLVDREVTLYKKLMEKGIRVTFVTYGDEEDYLYIDKVKGINIIPIYSKISKSNNQYFKIMQSFFILPFVLKQYLKKEDIFKTNQMWGAWVAIFSGLLCKKKVVLRCGYERYKNTRKRLRESGRFVAMLLLKYISKYSYKFSDKIILTSEGIERFVVEEYAINPGKITVLYNYIDIHLFKPMSFKKEDCKILYIGRLSKEKNIYTLLDAIAKTDFQLDIIGDGDLFADIETYIDRHSINANLLGRFPNTKLSKIINSYPVFVLPSYYEGNPKALLEAMACGCAVIGTNVEGIKEIIVDGKTGILCENNSDSIGQAINTLMKDQMLREKLGNNARDFVIEKCDLDYVTEKEYCIYKELLGVSSN